MCTPQWSKVQLNISVDCSGFLVKCTALFRYTLNSKVRVYNVHCTYCTLAHQRKDVNWTEVSHRGQCSSPAWSEIVVHCTSKQCARVYCPVRVYYCPVWYLQFKSVHWSKVSHTQEQLTTFLPGCSLRPFQSFQTFPLPGPGGHHTYNDFDASGKLFAQQVFSII